MKKGRSRRNMNKEVKRKTRKSDRLVKIQGKKIRKQTGT